MLMGCCLRRSCLHGIPINAWRCRSRPRCQLRNFSRSPAAPAIESLVIRQAVSMKCQHPRWPPSDRRTAAHRARRDIRSSSAVTRRTGHAEPGPTGRVEPDAGQRGVQHLLGRDQRVQVPGRAVLATSPPGLHPVDVLIRNVPGKLCHRGHRESFATGPNKERRCPRDGETDRSRGRNCAVRSDSAASHSPDVNPRDSGSINPGSVPKHGRSHDGRQTDVRTAR